MLRKALVLAVVLGAVAANAQTPVDKAAELQKQLDVANEKIADQHRKMMNHMTQNAAVEARRLHEKARAEAAEAEIAQLRKQLATACGTK